MDARENVKQTFDKGFWEDYSSWEANVQFLRFPHLRTLGLSFSGLKMTVAALCHQLHTPRPKRMFYVSTVKKKKSFPVDILWLGPKMPPKPRPTSATSKENKITKTVSDPASGKLPNRNQREFPRGSWQAMIRGLIPTSWLFCTACKQRMIFVFLNDCI